MTKSTINSNNIVEFLTANKDLKVEAVMPQLMELLAKKAVGSKASTSLRDVDNNILAVKCWYHKRWELLVGDDKVEFGTKANTSTGLNTMCKEGSTKWYQQDRNFRLAEADLLKRIMSKSITVDEAQVKSAEYKLNKDIIVDRKTGESYATREECLERLKAMGLHPVD